MDNTQLAQPLVALIGEREQQFEMLLHVQEFSSLVVLITGPTGLGKTHFLTQAESQLAVHHQTILFSAAQASTQPQIIEILAERLGCLPHLEAIEQKLAQYRSQQESVHIFVDDAHLLQEEALIYLLTKSQMVLGWHLVLAGDEQLAEASRHIEQNLQQGNILHQLQLFSFSEDDCQQFIKQQYQAAGYDALPLTQKQIHQYWLLSEGIPQKLLSLLQIESANQQGLTSSFPMGHVAAIALIGLALGLSYFYQEPSSAEDDLLAKIELNNEAMSNPAREKPEAPKIEQMGSRSGVNTEPQVSNIVDNGVANNKHTVQNESPLKLSDQPVSTGVLSLNVHPLLQAKADGYALQLLGVRNKDRAEAFMARFARELGIERLSIYETRFKSEPWHVVVYGPFANKQLAADQIDRLKVATKSQPWVRPVSKIQEDIRKNKP